MSEAMKFWERGEIWATADREADLHEHRCEVALDLLPDMMKKLGLLIAKERKAAVPTSLPITPVSLTAAAKMLKLSLCRTLPASCCGRDRPRRPRRPASLDPAR